MVLNANIEAALAVRRADTLSKLGNSARASDSQRARNAIDSVVDRAYGAVPERKADDETPFDPRRGRKLNISV